VTDQPSSPFAYDVFISYSHADSTWVHGQLLARLDQAGLRTFIDFRDFELGAPSVTEIERGVLTSRKTLLVLTPAYLASDWATFEAFMLQTLDPINRGRRLIPLFKEHCTLPPRIGMLSHVDFTNPATIDLAWQRLLQSLAGANVTVPPPTPPTIRSTSTTPPSPAAMRRLREVLAQLFSEQRNVQRVAGDAGLSIQAIDWGGSVVNNWHAVLGEARKQNQLATLLAVAQAEYPHHADLAAAIAEVS